MILMPALAKLVSAASGTGVPTGVGGRRYWCSLPAILKSVIMSAYGAIDVGSWGTWGAAGAGDFGALTSALGVRGMVLLVAVILVP